MTYSPTNVRSTIGPNRQGGLTAKKRGPQLLEVLFVKVAMTYSPTNVRSTIGADGLNFSVRNGKRWIPDAIDRLNV